jgi:hypothetical protein
LVVGDATELLRVGRVVAHRVLFARELLHQRATHRFDDLVADRLVVRE